MKTADTTRPVIFSYPGNVSDNVRAYDLLSMHYPDISGNMTQHGIETKAFGFDQMPVIFDEWAHVACYCNFTVKEDPNIRDFWGQSLDKMWQKAFTAEGGLGGAIWGMIDETFMLPDTLPGFNEWWGIIDKNVIPAEYTGHTVGYGEWGIVDTWRRKKPEFWNTKKAYSPVKLKKTVFDNYQPGESLEIPVYNRFDHTNFNELDTKWTYKKKTQTLEYVDLEPHGMGTLFIPIENWEPDEPIVFECFNGKGRLIDKYVLRQKPKPADKEQGRNTGKIDVVEKAGALVVYLENGSSITFDKHTGLIKKIQNPEITLNCSGPFLNFRTKGEGIIYSSHIINDYGKDWKLSEFVYKSDKQAVTLFIKGDYSDVKDVQFQMTIAPDGEMDIQYAASDLPDQFVREAGLKFIFDESFDAAAWKRDPYWSYYPENHTSAREGKTPLYSKAANRYREKPAKDWAEDTKSFYYNGTNNEEPNSGLTNKARSTKEYIREFRLLKDDSELIKIVGDGSISCRLSKERDQIYLHVNHKWDYVDLSWGNYQKNLKIGKELAGSIKINLN